MIMRMHPFLKPFTLCLLMCGLFLFPITAKAADSEISISANVTETITYEENITKDDNWTIIFKNTTSGNVKISDLKIISSDKIGSSSSGKLKLQAYMTNGWKDYNTAYSPIIAPGATCKFLVTATAQTFTNVKLQYTATVYKTYNISNDENKPIPIVFDQEITGPVYQQGYYNQYYSLTLTEASTVTINLTGECSYYLRNSIGEYLGCASNRLNTSGTETFKLAAGTYDMKLIGGGASDIGKEYTLKVSAVPYDFGTVNVDWNIQGLVGACNVPFTVTLTGSPETYVYSAGSELRSYGDRTSTGWSGVLNNSSAGYHTLRVVLYADGYGFKEYTYEYHSIPETPILLEYSFNVGTTKMNLKGSGRIQMKDGNKWVDVKNVKPVNVEERVVSGLKPDTQYTFRLISCIEEEGKEPLYSAPSKQISIITGSKKKPAVKSIKAYGYKTKYIPRKYNSGYYDTLGIWHRGYYTGGYYTTSYKLKIVLKKKAPGLKTKYLSVNGTICKLKGKSCTYSDYYRGKRTKKKLKVKIATAKSDKYRGTGAAVTKTITLR